MGTFPTYSPKISLDLKGRILSKITLPLKGQKMRKWVLMRKQRVISRGRTTRRIRPRRVPMKRKLISLEASRRSSNSIQRPVKALKELITNMVSMKLDGLLRETADYILVLQTRVRVMQTMVRVLTRSNDV